MVKLDIKILFWVIFTLFQVIFFTESSVASSLSPCGELKNFYGPFDYTNAEDRKNLPIVENYHFTPEVENLIRGKSATNLWADINYTLRVFPNHHRALYAFARYEIRERKKSRQENKPYIPPMAGDFPATAECYFDRAMRWRPNDSHVYLIYGLYFQLSGNLNQALVKYKISEKIQPNSADLQYNLGLLYFERKDYTLAKEHARKAYQLGYPLPGLRKKLASVGQWP